MYTLEDMIERAEKKHGAGSRWVQMLKNQLQAAKTNQSTQELYITGSISYPQKASPAKKE